jgi:hypothetical protein
MLHVGILVASYAIMTGLTAGIWGMAFLIARERVEAWQAKHPGAPPDLDAWDREFSTSIDGRRPLPEADAPNPETGNSRETSR